MVKKNGISCAVICRADDPDVEECVAALKMFDETVVVCDGHGPSIKKARRLGARVFVKRWKGFADQKNFAVKKVSNEMVLSVDSDELVTPELAAELIGISEAGKKPACYIPRKNYFYGKWLRHSGLYPDYQLRFFPKKSSLFSGGDVHEAVRSGAKEKMFLKNHLVHRTKKDIYSHIESLNSYTTLEVLSALRSGKTPTGYAVMIKPVYDFIKFYFFKLGFLDGFEGLVFNYEKSMYTFLSGIKACEKFGLDFRVLLKTLFKRSR